VPAGKTYVAGPVPAGNRFIGHREVASDLNVESIMSTARSRRSWPRPPWAFLFGRTTGPRGRSLPRRGLEPAAGCERLEPRAVLAAVPPAPLVTLVQDTGGSATDRITSVAALAVTTAQDAAVEYSVDGGRVWAPSFAPLPGVNRLLVRQTAPGSGTSAATSFSFTFDDTAPAALAVSLKLDTGAAGSDRVTKDGTLAFIDPVTKKTSVESGATVQFQQGESDWGAAFTPVEGVNTVKVRQVDKAGNASPASTLEFTLDRKAPVAPAVSLANDTNVPDDRITSVGTLVAATTGPAAVEPTASIQYSTTSGKTWTGSFAPKTGANAVLVRQVDLAGNASAPTAFTFTYDPDAPAAPQLALAADTGVRKTDRITGDGTLSFANPATKKSSLETGATVAYSVLQPDGVTWSEWSASFAPADGAITVRARQADRAGNVSAASAPLAFTLVRQPPAIAMVTAPAAKTYAAGQSLEFTVGYSRPVTVSPLSGATAVPYLDLTVGGASRQATYVSGSGTDTLVFRAAVSSGDCGAVSVGGTVRLPTNAFIRDIAGNDASTTFTPPDADGVLVDALVPVASMSFDPVALSATIYFTRPVTGVDVEDFRIRGTVFGRKLDLPVNDPLIYNTVGDVTVTGSGGQWTLSVQSPPPGGGSLTLVLVAARSGIVDDVGNPLKADASVTVSR